MSDETVTKPPIEQMEWKVTGVIPSSELDPEREIAPEKPTNEAYGLPPQYHELLGGKVTVKGILSYVAAEKGRLDELIPTLTKDDRPMNTLAHDTLLERLELHGGVNIADPEFNFGDIEGMTAREWRMLLGILDAPGGPRTVLQGRKKNIGGLQATIKKIGEYVDNYEPPRESVMHGWTVPVYDKNGQVVKYTQPKYMTK